MRLAGVALKTAGELLTADVHADGPNIRELMDDVRPSVPLSAAAIAHKPVILCFSHLRWGFVFQRPQHLLSRAARQFRVIYVEEPVHHDGVEPHLYEKESDEGVTVVVPVLPSGLDGSRATAMLRRLADEIGAMHGSGPRIGWYYTPMALAFTDHLRFDRVVYDCMDELSAFRFAPPDLEIREAALFRRADVAFTGGHSLFEAKRHRHANIHAFPSSIDAAHFAQARGPNHEPPDQASIGHPRLGFFGVVDERMDLELLAAAAALRPDWRFVMVGPIAKLEEADLPKAANIHWLGARDYRELPAYLSGWDVGIMPFAVNDATRYISPTKTPEFLAAGVPVVSTPIRDVVRFYGETGLVEIAADAQTFIEKADMLMRRPRQPWLDQVDAALARGSWDRTWADMLALIEAAPSARMPERVPRSAGLRLEHV